MNVGVTNQSKRLEENFTRRCLRRLRNKNGEYHVNLCESNIFEAQAIFPI